MSEAVDVRKVVGENIARIRKVRGLTVRDLAPKLKALGFPLSASGVSDVERADRKLAADELLIFAIALNCSVIDLLTSTEDKPLKLADGIEPLPAESVESWLAGDHPWPPVPTNSAIADEFFATASEFRKRKQRTDMRPELQELGSLRDAVASAIDGPGPLNQVGDSGVMAQQLRDQLERVKLYVKLLADQLEKQGYAAR